MSLLYSRDNSVGKGNRTKEVSLSPILSYLVTSVVGIFLQITEHLVVNSVFDASYKYHVTSPQARTYSLVLVTSITKWVCVDLSLSWNVLIVLIVAKYLGAFDRVTCDEGHYLKNCPSIGARWRMAMLVTYYYTIFE